MLRRLFNWLCLCGFLCSPAYGLDIVVSNKPLHSLVLNLLDENDTASLLKVPQQSGHHFSLRPGDIKQLQQAQLVIWIGQSLELGLARAIQLLDSEILTVGDTLVDAGSNTVTDSHFWLDPVATQEVVRVMVKALIAINPQSASIYDASGDRLIQRLDQLYRQFQRDYKASAPGGLVLLHDGYRWHQKRFGLGPVTVVNIDGHQYPPGLKQLRKLRASLQLATNHCLLADVHTPRRIIASLRDGLDIKVEILDPVGVHSKAGPELYFAVLSDTVAKISRCAGRGEP